MQNVSVEYWQDSNLFDNLKNAWCTVSFSSTAAAVGLVEGVPAFVTSQTSYLNEFNAGDLSKIETPNYIDRKLFFTKYANTHWSKEEVKQGNYWERINKFL